MISVFGGKTSLETGCVSNSLCGVTQLFQFGCIKGIYLDLPVSAELRGEAAASLKHALCSDVTRTHRRGVCQNHPILKKKQEIITIRITQTSRRSTGLARVGLG